MCVYKCSEQLRRSLILTSIIGPTTFLKIIEHSLLRRHWFRVSKKYRFIKNKLLLNAQILNLLLYIFIRHKTIITRTLKCMERLNLILCIEL